MRGLNCFSSLRGKTFYQRMLVGRKPRGRRQGKVWRLGLLVLTILLAAVRMAPLQAAPASVIKIDCRPQFLCAPYLELWTEYLDQAKNSQEGVNKIIYFIKRTISDDGSLQNYTSRRYQKTDPTEGLVDILEINLVPRPQIRNISFETLPWEDVQEIMSLLPVRQGDYYTSLLGKESLQTVRQYLTEHGQSLALLDLQESFIDLAKLRRENTATSTGSPTADLAPEMLQDPSWQDTSLVLFVDLHFKVKVAQTFYVRQMVYPAQVTFMRDNLALRFDPLLNKKFNRPQLKAAIDNLVRELIGQGFYHARVDAEGQVLNPQTGDLRLVLHVKPGKRLQFAFRGNTIFERADLMNTIQEILQGAVEEEKAEDLVAALKQKYRAQGHLQSIIKWKKRTGQTKEGLDYVNYYFSIQEGPKTYVDQLNFKTSEFFTVEQLKDLYQDQASPLAAAGGLDEDFIANFAKILKREYARYGLLQAVVEAPVVFDAQARAVDVNYQIQEGVQTILMELNLGGIPPAMAMEIKRHLTNQEGTPFNVVDLGQDIQKITTFLQEHGYYWAKISNLAQRKFLSYAQHDQQAFLNFEIHLGPQLVFRDTILQGNYRTHDVVITREVHLKPGDIITPSKLQALSERLEGLGPFARVKVFPLVEDRKAQDKVPTEIMIQVQEHDFGMIEIAPGYRTDVGLKLGAAINYNNLSGKNRAINFKTQINQRLEDKQFEPGRPQSDDKLLEYGVNLGFKEPYFLGFPLELSTDFSYRYKRYFSFDATISAFELQFYKSWNKYFSTFTKYQIEGIKQKNSLQAEEMGHFRIGSIQLGFDLDGRDHALNPRFGHYLGVVWERSAPGLGSKDGGFTINYHKLILRHKFYHSQGPWTLAWSAVGGVEKQLSSSGHIPSIKVFRLEGTDLIRGYADDESNHIMEDPEQRDINKFLITDKAYLLNFKLGLRYLVNDNVAIGPFFDAGRVYLNQIKHLSLRTAAGIGLKIITPVGSIDFDYGVKLHRYTIEGRRESIGRFHFSIGSF